MGSENTLSFTKSRGEIPSEHPVGPMELNTQAIIKIRHQVFLKKQQQQPVTSYDFPGLYDWANPPSINVPSDRNVDVLMEFNT